MRKHFFGVVILIAALAGCRASHPPALQPATQPTTRPADRLAGTWVSDRLDPRTGNLQIKLTFSERPHEKLLSWSELPLRGAARTTEAPFTATDEAIESGALGTRQAIPYRFDEKGRLVVRRADGTVVAFHRVK